MVGRSVRVLAAGVVALLLAGGCQVRVESDPALKFPETPPITVPGGEQTVPMLVLKGPDGQTMALVPVFINGQGPFAFALDTGASSSVLDLEVATRLGLAVSGPAVEVTGVAAAANAVPAQVDQWRVGGVTLPAGNVVTMDLADFDRQMGLHGLLGSDVLSRFEVIVVDYKKQELTFRPGPIAGEQPAVEGSELNVQPVVGLTADDLAKSDRSDPSGLNPEP